MICRKGQAATEYLIILAVVVIIALIVVGVMGGFPRLTGGISKAESRTYWSVAEIAILGASLNGTSGEIGTIVVRNNKNFDVEVTELGMGGNATAAVTSTPSRIVPGGTATIQLTANTHYPAGTIDNEYSFSVTMKYKDADNPALVYSFTGDVPLVESYQ